MKRIALIFVWFCLLLSGCTQAQDRVTTFILVRHAEKENDGTKDPDLTEAGKQRASELVRVLNDVKIDAIYSTAYQRTQNTVKPIADAKNLKIISYNAMQGNEMDKIFTEHKGGTVVIAGHSNTTPWVANYFLGADVYPDFEDADYDNIIFLSIIDKGNAKATLINFGKSTP